MQMEIDLSGLHLHVWRHPVATHFLEETSEVKVSQEASDIGTFGTR